MCLIALAWGLVQDTPLVAAGNRDEFFERPAAPATWWEDQPEIYAGRDLRGGGTWLGVSRTGRFAAITNIRDPAGIKPDAPSRGHLVAEFLSSGRDCCQYIDGIAGEAGAYNGFNLLICDGRDLVWFTNGKTDDERNGKPLPPGFYGLSNAALDTPWPKVVRTKAQFASLLCQGAPDEAYFDMLSDTTRSSDCRLPKTGVSLELERLFSAICIESPNYGTRASSIVRMQAGREPVLIERFIR